MCGSAEALLSLCLWYDWTSDSRSLVINYD
jgi:hypothetical protein